MKLNPDNKIRCEWALSDMLSLEYHDSEWGVPVFDDKKLFEFVVLETAQAGLSWSLILHKRKGYRHAFAGFDPHAVAEFNEDDIGRLVKNPDIIRNRKKIEATVTNALAFLEVSAEFGGFAKYIWGFVGEKPKINAWQTAQEVPATSPESEALSKDLKKRGFKFMGAIVSYAHMQATGMVNDHQVGCFRYNELLP